MKKARRFFAMLLGLTLCIVSLPFSAHAVHDDSAQSMITPRGPYCTCSTPDYYLVGYGNFVRDEIVGTRTVCVHRYYDRYQVKCRHCEYVTWMYQQTYQEVGHEENFIWIFMNGKYVEQCERCGYIKE